MNRERRVDGDVARYGARVCARETRGEDNIVYAMRHATKQRQRRVEKENVCSSPIHMF